MKAFEFILFLIGLLISFGAACYCGISYRNSKQKMYFVYTIAFSAITILVGVALVLGAVGV